MRKNRLPANLQRLKQKLNLWPVPLKSPGSKFKEGGGGWFVNIMSNIYYIDVARLEFPWFGAIIEKEMITKWKNRVDFLLRSTTYMKWIKFGKMRVLWIRQLTWKQDFSRVNNRREVQLDKDAWNASKFKKIKKKCHFKKIECSLRAFWPKLVISIKWVENEYRLK